MRLARTARLTHSSPHVYIRLPEGFAWDKLAGTDVLIDAAQLCKAGSIEGNKRDNVTVIYCPASNLCVTALLGRADSLKQEDGALDSAQAC